MRFPAALGCRPFFSRIFCALLDCVNGAVSSHSAPGLAPCVCENRASGRSQTVRIDRRCFALFGKLATKDKKTEA